ncbi:MAG TPA: ATP-binding protein [Petrimonas sp.]|nr:ATP-binding protein [Petrimonas sp.]
MRIKTKLILSFGLLLVLVIGLGIVGGKYIYILKADTENILTDNYMSLEYAKDMLSALEQPDSNKALKLFENNLKKQEKNITEIGEADLTKNLRTEFEQYTNTHFDNKLKTSLRNNLLGIIELNMNAIKQKSEIAKTTANNAFVWISITGTLCFLIAFTLFFNLPSDIANPIKELTASIKQIAEKNYSKRIIVDEKNEFGELAHSFNVMAEKLEEYNNSNVSQLLFEKKRIETLINNMSDPVLGLDEDKKVIFINQEALKILNMNEGECINNFISNLSLKNDLFKLLADSIDIEETTIEPKKQPIKIFANNKESYFEKEVLHISILPTGEEETRIVGHVIILRNVTEYKEVDFAKTNFIATISHELKTPIASIKMSLQLLDNNRIGNLNEDQAQLLASIKDDANRLLKITGELLNITQIESGNIQLSIMPVDPDELINYAINAIKTQADNKKIRFEINRPEVISMIHADNEKTAWVITNLLSNAVRYSHENSVVYITLKEENEQVLISVRDSGMGIAHEYKDKIFNRYFRVPGTRKEGSGLGLSISKEFIEAQGGEISIESEIGNGSIFTVKLNVV